MSEIRQQAKILSSQANPVQITFLLPLDATEADAVRTVRVLFIPVCACLCLSFVMSVGLSVSVCLCLSLPVCVCLFLLSPVFPSPCPIDALCATRNGYGSSVAVCLSVGLSVVLYGCVTVVCYIWFILTGISPQ